MKTKKLLCVVTAITVSISVLFAGCSRSNDNKGGVSSTMEPPVSSAPETSPAPSDGGVLSDVEDGAGDLVSDVEDGIGDLASDVEEMLPGETDGNQSTTENNSSLSSSKASPDYWGSADVQARSPEIKNISALDGTKQGWGQGLRLNDKNQPESSVVFQEKYGQYGTYFIAPDDEKNIYLTFDEGYENGYTSQILDILKEKEVSAVFFVTMPYVKQNPDLIQRMIDEGHVVGNHSVRHLSFPTIDPETCKSEVMELHNYIKETFNGYEMNLFRYPMGEFSEQTLALVQSLGYRTLFWSFAYADWDQDKQPDPGEAYTKITKNAHPGGIFLLHAVSKTNTEILGRVIDNIREQGYTFLKCEL